AASAPAGSRAGTRARAAAGRMVNEASGGEGGIRTRGTLPYTRFPVVHLRPLGHLSVTSGGLPSTAPVPRRVGFAPHGRRSPQHRPSHTRRRPPRRARRPRRRGEILLSPCPPCPPW